MSSNKYTIRGNYKTTNIKRFSRIETAPSDARSLTNGVWFQNSFLVQLMVNSQNKKFSNLVINNKLLLINLFSYM